MEKTFIDIDYELGPLWISSLLSDQSFYLSIYWGDRALICDIWYFGREHRERMKKYRAEGKEKWFEDCPW